MAGCEYGPNKPVGMIHVYSGTANTGFQTGSVARRLMKQGTGSTACLAAFGTDFGIEKGKTLISHEVIKNVTAKRTRTVTDGGC